MRNSREHSTPPSEASSPDPKEQSEASFARAVGPVMRLDDVLKHFAENGRVVDQKDLIVLTTADGTLVCPKQQLTERTDEAGNRTWEISPYAIALWKVTELSGHNGWTRAASLAVKHKITGYQYSLFDIATNREISDDYKQSALQYVLRDEDKRAVCSGDRDFNKKRGEVVAYIENVLGIPVTK